MLVSNVSLHPLQLGAAAEMCVRLRRTSAGGGAGGGGGGATSSQSQGAAAAAGAGAQPPFWVTGRLDARSGREWFVCHHEAVPAAVVERLFNLEGSFG